MESSQALSMDAKCLHIVYAHSRDAPQIQSTGRSDCVSVYVCLAFQIQTHQRVTYTTRKNSETMAQRPLCDTTQSQDAQSEDVCSITFFTWSEWYCVWETTIEQCSTQAAGSGREEEGSVVWGGIFSLFSIFRYFSDSTYFITLNLIIENNLVILHLELCIFIGCICHMSSLKKVLINQRNMPSNTFQQI